MGLCKSYNPASRQHLDTPPRPLYTRVECEASRAEVEAVTREKDTAMRCTAVMLAITFAAGIGLALLAGQPTHGETEVIKRTMLLKTEWPGLMTAKS